MTKKKKIIISAVTVGVILIGIIISVILANIKRFDIYATDKFDYNNHENMIVIDRDSSYTYSNSYFAGGTEIVRKTSTNKMGLYSYVKNKNVVAPEYDDVSIVNNNVETNKSYFRLNQNSLGNMIKIVDENGEDLSFLHYDQQKKVTTSEIKTKTINLKKTKNTVKTKINNKYHNETITIKSVAPASTGNYDSYYYEEGKFYYEVWELKTTDNLTYINLYKVENGKHELVQTLNNELGVSLESQNLDLIFLTDGTPMLMNMRAIKYDTTTQALEYEMYDINFNLKGRSQINNNTLSKIVASARVGNSFVFQAREEATEDKYDYFETTTFGDKYYKLTTFKLNLKNANIAEVNFNYLINNINDNFNTKTALVSAQKIKNKKLTDQENLLLNERFQVKKIAYDFNTIYKINKDRYITSNNGTSNFNLIDKNYKLITHLENFNNVFATNNALIVSDSERTYVCNFDGVVIKKIANADFYYLNDSRYYMTSQTRTTDAGTYTDYYLEELGLTHSDVLYTKNPSGYTYNGGDFSNVIVLREDYATLIITVKSSGGLFDYNIYNINGKLLGQVNGITTNSALITALYYNDNNVVLKMDTKYLVLDR